MPDSVSTPGPWVFVSSSKASKKYTVTRDGKEGLNCDCPGFQFRRECKHVVEVRAGNSVSEIKTEWLEDASRSGKELGSAIGRFVEADRLIAGHASALPETLSTLSRSSDMATRAKVTANPNTPVDDYVRLGREFPKEFLSNWALALLLLENPAFFQELPDILLVEVVKNPECPAVCLIWAASQTSEEVQLAVAMNATVPAAALSRLCESAHEAVREAAAAVSAPARNDPEPQFREAVRERLSKLDVSDAVTSWNAKDIGLAQFAQLSAAARREIISATMVSQSSDSTMPKRSRVAKPAVPPEVLRSLPKDGEEAVDLPWYTVQFGKLREDAREALARGDFLHYSGSNPNKAVLAERPLAAVMALCAGPFVEPARIKRLADSSDWLVRAAVARNRGTPGAVRKKLKADAVPLVRALAAAAPELTADVAADSEPSYSTERVLVEIRAKLKKKKGESVRCLVAASPQAPVQLLELLAKDKEPLVRLAIAENPRVPLALRVAFLEVLAKESDSEVCARVAENIDTPAEVLEELARSSEEYIRQLSAEKVLNDREHQLRARFGWLPVEFAKDREQKVRAGIAENPNSPALLLEALANDKEERVRESVAANPNSPVSLLDALAKDTDELIRRSVAWNPNTPVAVLEALAKDKALWVRKAVAKNPNTPASLLEALSTDKEDHVRASVAENSSAPVSLLKALTTDKVEIRSRVACNPTTSVALLEALAKDPSSRVRVQVAKSPQAPTNLVIKLLSSLAQSPSSEVRYVTAQHPQTPEFVLEALAKDEDDSVRAQVARNRNTPGSVLETLSGDVDSFVSDAANRNPAPINARIDEVSLLLRPRAPGSLPESSLLWWIRRLTDLPVTADYKRLTKASRSKEWLLRFGVALHPGATDTTLKLLSADSNADVAGAARMKRAERARTG